MRMIRDLIQISFLKKNYNERVVIHTIYITQVFFCYKNECLLFQNVASNYTPHQSEISLIFYSCIKS